MFRILAATIAFSTVTLTAVAPSQALAFQAVRPPSLSPQETRDRATYDQAAEDFQRRGYPALTSRLPDLRQAFDRMPADYGLIAEQDGVRIARVSDMNDLIVVMVSMSAPNDKGDVKGAVAQPNVYGDIAMLLASEAVQRRRYDEALAYVDRALAAQPKNWALLTEKAAALHGAARWQEALDLSDAALADNDLLLTLHRGPFHRLRGFSLIELNRLDEAKAAYEAALEIDADDANARRELDYIAQVQAGAERKPPELLPSEGSPPT